VQPNSLGRTLHIFIKFSFSEKPVLGAFYEHALTQREGSELIHHERMIILQETVCRPRWCSTPNSVTAPQNSSVGSRHSLSNAPRRASICLFGRSIRCSVVGRSFDSMLVVCSIRRWSFVRFAVGRWSLVVGRWSLVVGRWSFVVRRSFVCPSFVRSFVRPFVCPSFVRSFVRPSVHC